VVGCSCDPLKCGCKYGNYLIDITCHLPNNIQSNATTLQSGIIAGTEMNNDVPRYQFANGLDLYHR
jgi:hypothetical protein